MTAYSSTILNNNGNKTTIEIKCLNSKSIDVSCKIPNDLKEKDHAIRKLISKSLQRGKVELSTCKPFEMNLSFCYSHTKRVKYENVT